MLDSRRRFRVIVEEYITSDSHSDGLPKITTLARYQAWAPIRHRQYRDGRVGYDSRRVSRRRFALAGVAD